MSEQQKTKQFNVFKKWWFWVSIGAIGFIFIMVLFVSWLFSSVADNPKLLVVKAGEQVVVSGVNLGISNSALDGSGEITNFDCLTLSKIATRNGGDFFSDSACEPGSIGFVAKSEDTAQVSIVTLYPRTGGSILNCTANIATFTFDKAQTELLAYSFKEDDCFQGAKLPISEVDVKTVSELSKYAAENQYKR
jgi:hypothetical protein